MAEGDCCVIVKSGNAHFFQWDVDLTSKSLNYQVVKALNLTHCISPVSNINMQGSTAQAVTESQN